MVVWGELPGCTDKIERETKSEADSFPHHKGSLCLGLPFLFAWILDVGGKTVRVPETRRLGSGGIIAGGRRRQAS